MEEQVEGGGGVGVKDAEEKTKQVEMLRQHSEAQESILEPPRAYLSLR